MEALFFLFIFVAIITVIGHLIWVAVRAILRWVLLPDQKIEQPSAVPHLTILDHKLKDLATTERVITQFFSDGKLSDEIYQQLMKRILDERATLLSPRSAAPKTEPVRPSTRIVTPPPPQPPPREAPPSVVTSEPVDDEVVFKPVPSFINKEEPEPVYEPPPPPPPPRRPFSEVLNSFMEESNIRWGEIIGGLLIIGCSTALVVSLWAQISQIPVLKFLIFTTVTAILFGIGLYTEHRWKLPTTSRGILTIATLLVPLNFLAIAAVSASNTSGALVIGSELLAPAIFLCLVYFAGRVITPGCAHILSAGVLGSSIGQLLVRHFASLDGPPLLLIFLGAFPVLCYVVTVALALRVVLHDREIDASETTTVFTVLGAMSFAALLPFGLLLYKSGPLGMSMMYLAPIVTLWGLPMVATGAILWKRIKNRELVASRTTGTALGILGLMIVLAGMMLAWPNPSSIVPAALLNFAIFTVLAVALRIPFAHLIAAICFALAYVVTFHVFAGSMTWVNLRVMSLLNTTLSLTTGQALVGAFALFLAASEWLSRRRRKHDSFYYLVSACLVAMLSLAFTTYFGIWTIDYHALWIVYGLYSLGAFWIASRRKLAAFTWAGSALLLFSLAHGLGQSLAFSFPWQTALFAHATICAIAAILISRYPALPRSVLAVPLNYSALISIVLGVVGLFQANQWEVTWMQAQRVFWIAGILLLLLWLNRRRLLFNAFQIALICALVLTIKAWLQQYEWYLYLPFAFTHPAALQIQGIVLAFFCLTLLALRFLLRRAPTTPDGPESWQSAAARLLDTRYSVDRLLVWLLTGAFLVFAVYGAFSGVVQELAGVPTATPSFNIAGFPHQEAFAFGSWILLGLLALIMIASFWDRRRRIYLLGALATLAAAIPLLAGRFETHISTATAWRWFAALFLLAISLLLWFRKEVSKRLRSFGWPALDGTEDRFVSETRLVLIILTVLPLIVLTVLPALLASTDIPLSAPTTGIFSLFDHKFSYGIPLVLVALVMIGHALRERMPEFTFYAGVIFNLSVTLAYLLTLLSGESFDDGVALVRVVQLNVLTFAVYSLPWLSSRGRWQSALNEGERKFANFLIKLQLGIAIVLNAMLVLPILFELVRVPAGADAVTLAAGSFLGWLTFVITVVAVAWASAGRKSKPSAYAFAALLFGINCLFAFSMSGSGGWAGVHALTVSMTVTAWLMLAAAELNPDNAATLPFPLNLLSRRFELDIRWQSRCRELATVAGSLAVFFSLRSVAHAEANQWWSVGPLLAITALAAALSWKTSRRIHIYCAGILFSIAVSLWWMFVLWGDGLTNFLLTNLIAAALAGILWLWLELRARQRSEDVPNTIFSFHNLVAISSLGFLVLFVGRAILEPWQSPLLAEPLLSWIGFFAVLIFIAACVWDKHAKYAVAGLYTLGLIACGMVLHLLQLSHFRLIWSITIFLALYSLAVALLWRSRERIIVFVEQFGIPRRISSEVRELPWLSAFTILAVVTFGCLAFWINLQFLDLGMRVSASLAVAAQFLTFGLLAEGAGEQHWRRAAVAVLVFGAVLLGWSWLTPGVDATWLNRSVILMLEAFGLTAVYGLLLDKATARFPQWTSSARACVPWLLGAGVIALFFCLGTEIFYQLNFGMVNIHPVALAAIGLTLIASVVICVLFALSPKHDPMNLSEHGRTRYVYVAEVMLALLFLHVRLTMPWLFSGFIERYWPLVVMAIAYFGVVASEALRRRKLFVLAHPLERTGAFLPLLPVLGFWIASSEIDFSLVLFVVGGLYGLLSILRKSFAFGMLAAIAGNAGLWYMWNRTEHFQFLQHPQLWLIPVALSVLIAAYLNEDSMTEDQMTGIRYLSLVTIYVSSTADIFINGVANSPWLPLILGSFSLAGVFAGISFRIRGLLLLGSIFLLLSILTMIWYASANFGWTWLWYVAGIVTGATIIFMFAVFEKKRNEVLRVVEGLKEWDR